jgi:CoA:oxalate CoA-transferase
LLTPLGSHNPHDAPLGAYRCKDGYIIIATVGDEHWLRLCRAMGKPEWASDPGYRTKRQRWEKKYVLAEEIEKWTANYTVKEVGEILDRERVANSPILNIKQVVEDPHLNAREYFVEVEHPIIGKAKIPGIPFKLSETPGKVERSSPLVGENNELILSKYLGLNKSDVSQLKAEGVL